jgi:DNA replication and repair protein RecF
VRLSWLTLSHFRSYAELDWRPDPRVNVLVGPNAAGKTNAIEAVAYLATLRSFRGATDQTLIDDAATAAVLRGEIDRGESDILIEVEIPRDGRRRAQVNRQRLSRLADLLGHVRCVAFLPDDLDIIKRSPGYRRDFFDAAAVQIWPVAAGDQQDYDRALRQRNTLLKQSGRHVDMVTLGVWDERLSQAGSRLMQRRQQAIAATVGEIERVYSQLAHEPHTVQVDYQSTWGTELGAGTGAHAERLRDALEAAHRADMDRRVTTVGPHRDDPVIRLSGRDSRSRASQGEQRTLTLAMRIAAHRAIEQMVGEPPLLLLDDVFSELDMRRASALAEALPTAQTFITTARDEEVPLEGRRWNVQDGTIS